MTRRSLESGGVDRRALFWVSFCAFLGIDWGIAVAVIIEGLGGVIPTAASVAMVVAFGLSGGAIGFQLSRQRISDE